MDRALVGPRMGATFLAMVAGFAMVLALVGLYGIIANEAAERRTEMGLRMALGATPGRAVWTLGLTGLRLVAAEGAHLQTVRGSHRNSLRPPRVSATIPSIVILRCQRPSGSAPGTPSTAKRK